YPAGSSSWKDRAGRIRCAGSPRPPVAHALLKIGTAFPRAIHLDAPKGLPDTRNPTIAALTTGMGDLHMKRLALHLVVPALGLWLVAGCVGTDTHLGVGNTAGLEAELQSVAGIDESADPNSAGVSAIDETFEAELTLD